MENKQIKELMAAMSRFCIAKLSIKDENGFEVVLEREEHGVCKPQEFNPEYPAEMRSDLALRKAGFSGHEIPKSLTPPLPTEVESTGTFVTSPMVGTFYSSPSPDDPPFVKVGDRIEKNTIVCIIEAMKVMNEVKAGVSGIITEILPESGHPVEFGTKLIKVNPT